MYAAGKELDAMRRLEAAIKSNENLGDSTIRAWACLFELLQVLGRQVVHDVDRVPRRTAVVALRLHGGRRVHVGHDDGPRMLRLPGAELLGTDRVGERPPRVEIGEEDGFLR